MLRKKLRFAEETENIVLLNFSNFLILGRSLTKLHSA